MSVFRTGPGWMIHVRFEQGRGRTGVPKVWMEYFEAGSIATLVRMAVELLRAVCADTEIGHGRDILPGSNDEYQLHGVDGKLIENVGQITWEDFPASPQRRAELVLTWGMPSEDLARRVAMERSGP